MDLLSGHLVRRYERVSEMEISLDDLDHLDGSKSVGTNLSRRDAVNFCERLVKELG